MFGEKKRRKREAGIEVELPITPMLDMAFQLFAFFVFMYHPSALEGQMQLNLPPSGEAKAADKNDVQPSESDPELKLDSEVTITIKTKQDGINDSMPSHYMISTPVDTAHRLDRLEDLEEYLKRQRSDASKDEEVTIKADSRLKYTYVIQIMDACLNPKIGGFKHVGFGPPPDMEPPKSK